jgi:hypothetical protein
VAELVKLKIMAFYYCYFNRFGFFRIFGVGLYWKYTGTHSLSFSERNGYVKGIKIGNWYLGVLKKF